MDNRKPRLIDERCVLTVANRLPLSRMIRDWIDEPVPKLPGLVVTVIDMGIPRSPMLAVKMVATVEKITYLSQSGIPDPATPRSGVGARIYEDYLDAIYQRLVRHVRREWAARGDRPISGRATG